MRLVEFVESTLVQIVDGVIRANDKFQSGKTDAAANPPGAEHTHNQGTTYSAVSNVHDNSFDVAVTVDETTRDASKKRAGVAIKVVSGNLGKTASSETSHSTVSRLQFTIPLRLPRPTK